MTRESSSFAPFPLTDVQEAYWVGRQVHSRNANVSAHVYMEFESDDVDLERLEHSFNEVVRRHEMLRAVVRSDGRQVVLPEVPYYRILLSDLSQLEPERRESMLAATRSERVQEVRAADTWPLWDLRASRLSARRLRLHWSIDLLMLDGSSLALLLREWSAIYADPALELPPLTTTFREYVTAAQAARSEDHLVCHPGEAGLDKRWLGLPASPELPLRAGLDELSCVQFSRQAGSLDADSWSGLKGHIRKYGLTPSSFLCALYAEILRDWSRTPEFTLNLTSAFRLPLHPQIDGVIGDFTSTYLLAVDGEDDSFLGRALRLHNRLLNYAVRHRHTPSGVRVLKELSRKTGSYSKALMPVVFTSNLGRAGLNRHDFAFLGEIVYGVSQTPQVYLDHVVMEDGAGLSYHWDAVKDVFCDGVLEDMFGAYRDGLAALARDPERVRAGRLRSPPTRPRPDAAEPLGQPLLHGAFERWAERHPECPCIWTVDRTFSYGEILELSRRLAGKLSALGVLPETLVAVSMRKGWEQVVACMGILMSGGAYVPVDPDLPPLRIAELLEDAQVAYMLTQPELDEQLAWAGGVQRIVISEGALLGMPLPTPHLQPPITARSLAYVIYTSGSTGRPKGVMIEHGAAANTIHDINRRFCIGSEDTVLGLSSLSFDLSVYDVFGTLSCGARLALPRGTSAKDPGHWAHCLTAARVTVWNSVPALMELLLEHTGSQQAMQLPELRLVLLSGDWIPVNLPGRIRTIASTAQVISLGGATEASIWSIFHTIDRVDPSWTSIPYGRALTNQQVYVLDADLEPRHDHVPGELWIGGVGLARGYFRDEEKTRRSFIQHPRTGERLYRTGDWGRYLPDGTIAFLGRNDSQVKIHGHRVECGEIEAALHHAPGVRGAAVTTFASAGGEKRLAAFVVLDDEASSPGRVGELRAYLRERLPDYMVPAAILPCGGLPLSAVGKVDRAALQRMVPEALEDQRGEQIIDQTAPASQAEDAVAAIVARVLERASVGVHDNFFELGADSLHAIRILRAVEKAFGVSIGMERLANAPTVASIALEVEEAVIHELEHR